MSLGIAIVLTFTSGSARAATERASVSSTGDQGDEHSIDAAISADGRFVAFWGGAANLVPDDTNGASDVFVHDRQTGTTERVSVDSSGAQASQLSHRPAISADGRFVAFLSNAHLAPPVSSFPRVFVRDRLTGTTETVGFQPLTTPDISADGRFVAYASNDVGAVPNDTNNAFDVFVRDRLAATTERVSVDSSGIEGNGTSADAAISADGRFVTFISGASNLVPGDTNGVSDVFVRDRVLNTTERVSVASDESEGNNSSATGGAAKLSADGRFVAFGSHATNLVAGDTNNTFDIFVRDRVAGTTERVNVDSTGAEANQGSQWPAISGDGRLVAFSSLASNLVANHGFRHDVYIHDRQTGRTTQVSLPASGNADHGSAKPAISSAGTIIAFESGATTLVAGDTNDFGDIYVATSVCGDSTVDFVEECDDGNTVGGDCCSATCQLEANGSPCTDADACTQTDGCQAGVCTGTNPVVCTASDQCHDAGSCNPTTGLCSNPATADATPCDDGNVCTAGDGCQAGACTGPAAPSGTPCRPATDLCDRAETCAGTTCPADGVEPAGTGCRPVAGACDIAENCSGSSASCPADAVQPGGTACRSAAGPCDVAETCTGAAASCPLDGFASNGTPCDDADPCTSGDTCNAGACVGGPVDPDGDGLCDDVDNCDTTANPDQLDSDCDGNPATDPGCLAGGDVCDPCPALDGPICNSARSGGESIGPGGGMFDTNDLAVRVDVPNGALAADTSVTVTESLNDFMLDNAASPLIKVGFRPEGQHFLAPVEITFRWKDRDNLGDIDRGVCNGGLSVGLSCDKHANCPGSTCSNTVTQAEDQLVLRRNGNRFSRNGIGALPFRCQDHLEVDSDCETATANCALPLGSAKRTVASCCSPGTNEWTFQTCDFSEFVLGTTASDLIPGRGAGSSDCVAEWAVYNPLNEPALDAVGLPNYRQTCTDGNVLCDADGAVDGTCVFQVGICLNVADGRLPACSPSGVDVWEIRSPRPDSGNPLEAAGAVALRDAVLALGTGTVSGAHGGRVTFAPPLVEEDACTALVNVPVRLGGAQRRHLGTRMRSRTTGGRTDGDQLSLICIRPPL